MPYKDKTKQLAYQNAWIKRRRLDWLVENGPCVLCGSDDRLQVDHIDPSKKNTHRIWSYSKSKRDLELAKCRALCYSCHSRKSASECLKGEDNPRTTLTNLQVAHIKTEFLAGVRQRDLVKKYNVSKGTIYTIVRNKKWLSVAPIVQE